MQKIYFGDVVVQHTRTGETRTISGKVYKESDTPPAVHMRGYVLKSIAPKERPSYQIIRFCTETAKHVGDTTY
ncbi:hypothetical protein [Paludibacter jiangxiensis]|uniref:Uncharacterized protein n=1 Tax=Paludibacter jiangxiensis TaxID=681398 RepID=A0A171AW42_9BACT|nr:hypothetical protein [Paludibacter jiangxiensis]GAT64358.1 hypothetical protein PJIAN_4909 [Paludibacter jiangxiensis]